MIFEKYFYKEEIRNDFRISELMKRDWAAEIEILQIVSDICAQHNIRNC